MGSSVSGGNANRGDREPRASAVNAGAYFTEDQLNSMFFNGYPPQIPQAPPPVVHAARTVRNDVNVKKDSVTMRRDPSGPANVHFLRFNFDAAKACRVTVYCCVTETTNQLNVTTSLKPKRGAAGMSTLVHCPKGMKQVYDQGERKEAGFDVSLYSAADLTYKPSSPSKYPIVILLEATDDAAGTTEARMELPDANEVQSQLTYASLTKNADGSMSVKVLKQKIQVFGQAYELQAIYGIEQAGTGDDQCVVCLSNPKNTTVLPCRHMCLCRECAEELRLQTNKCPICRAPVTSLLKIDLERARRASGGGVDGGSAGEGAGEGAGAGAGAGEGAGSAV